MRATVHQRSGDGKVGCPYAYVWFTYSLDRKGLHPQGHLKNFTGFLQADAYAGYESLYSNGKIKEVACWAHARRPFYEFHAATGSPIALGAFQWIAQLYAIEDGIRGKPADERMSEDWCVRREPDRGTAKLHGLNPQTYLTHVLARVGDTKVSRVADLPPWNVANALAVELTGQ